MTFEGALIREQGVEFAVVIVQPQVIHSRAEAVRTSRSFQPLFPGIPIVLMAQDSRGTPTYLGRRDIVNFLANIEMERIPWQRFSVS